MTSSENTIRVDISHWCDYARGLVGHESARAMHEELTRSPRARKTLALLRQVLSVGRRDRTCEVPDYAVRVVKAVAGLSPHMTGSPFLRFLQVNLTFDSFQAAYAGTRDLPSSQERILSFEADEYSVHVKLELETNPYSQLVVGQLIRHSPELQGVPEIPVLVLAAGQVVGRSITSRFGEFQADGLPPDPLKLCLLVGPERCIDVPLGSMPPNA